MSHIEQVETDLILQAKKKESQRIASMKYFKSEKGKLALQRASKKYYLKKKEQKQVD
jgi:hypothetical protein